MSHKESIARSSSKKSRHSKKSKFSHSTTSSDLAAAITKSAVKKASLMCKQTALQKKQELEQQEFELQQQKEKLEIETELEMESAKLQVYEQYADSEHSQGSLQLEVKDSHESVQDWVDQSPVVQEPVVEKADVRFQTPALDIDQPMAASASEGVRNLPPPPSVYSREVKQEEIPCVVRSDVLYPVDDRKFRHRKEIGQEVDRILESPEVKVPPSSLQEPEPVVRPKVRPPKVQDQAASYDVNQPHGSFTPLGRQDRYAAFQPQYSVPPMRPYRDIQIPPPVDQFMPYYQGYGHPQPYWQPPVSVPTSRIEDARPSSKPTPTQHQKEPPVQDLPDQASQLSELTQLLIKQQIRSSLPDTKIMTFDGDPLKYTSFIRAFAFGVEDKTDSDRDRLEYLCQYTAGEAKRLVESCLHYEDPEEGYHKAKELLAKRFGSGHKIAQAVLKKAKAWQEVRDEEKSLNAFSLFLTECMNMMKSVEALEELDHSNTLKSLVSKLPYRLRMLWRNQVYSIEEELHNRVEFSDLVEFVDKQARIAANPVFGQIAKSSAESYSSSPKKRAFTTTTQAVVKPEQDKKPSTKSCTYCGAETRHVITECRKFTKLKPREKSEFCFSKRLCFGCLEEGHTKSACSKPLKCTKCSKVHPTVLHIERQVQSQSSSQGPAAASSPANNVTTGCAKTLASTTASDQRTPLMTIVPVLVKMKTSDRRIATYAFLDNGCGTVFAEQSLTDSLRVRTKRRRLMISTLLTEETVETDMVLGSMQVGNLDGSEFVDLPRVYVRDNIPVTLEDMPTQEDLLPWEHLSDVELPVLSKYASYEVVPKVTLMIGNSVPAATMPLDTRCGRIGQPYAVKTPLGWATYGIPGKFQNASSAYLSVVKDGVEELEKMFKAYVKRDFSEDLSDNSRSKSAEDLQFLDIAKRNTVFQEGHYHMCLPFRDKDLCMPNNRAAVEQRANQLKRQLTRDKEFHKEYSQAMEATITKGYAEVVPAEEIDTNRNRTWYIPHHGVRHPQKKKLRIVYDCAATHQNRSLNEELLQGPDLTNSLIGVLLRFRQEPVALSSDIEGMFHQVGVKKEDRDMLRFLWWPKGDLERPLQDHRMTVHLFGATSSPACANYALKQAALDNKDHFDKAVVDTVMKNFYVDDLLKSTETEEKGVKMAEDLRSITKKGGFNLTKWVSNSKKVMEAIPEEDRAVQIKDLDLDEAPGQKVLGMVWNISKDQFGYQVALKDKPATRRGMLSTLCSLYDPLGFASPVILPAKQMLQELCRMKYSWDEEVPSSIQDRWSKWSASLPELQEFVVDRCWKPRGFEDLKEVQMHHFSDASEIGYGTASYLRLVNASEEIECNLVISKARVAPIKQMSIPRMELAAATLAVRVDTMLKRELDIQSESVFWTDSQTVLKYIKNETARYPVFVGNRVAVIRDGSSPAQWRYVPSDLNPADHASRGLTVSQLTSKTEWLKGPKFLEQPEDEWPVANEEPDQDENLELLEVAVNTTQVLDTKNPTDQLLEHYSRWHSLKRAVAYMLRLKAILKQKVKDKTASADSKVDKSVVQKHATDSSDSTSSACILTLKDIEEAEKAIVKYVQKKSFSTEVEALERNLPVKGSSSVLSLDPQMKEGMMRVGGRLKNAKIPQNAKHQLIIPKDHHIATLIIRNIHEKVHHQGSNHVLAELRQKFWIVNARAKVKSVLGKCVVCRKHRAPVSKQKMADLPSNRVQADEPAFTSTGVDYFGPFYVKQGRVTRKRYGILFTCLNSRAVHIEVAHTMDTSSCIDAIRRFIARRGPVKEFLSDNGTNFVGADNELRRAWEELDPQQIQNYAIAQDFTWKFNPPAASHHGGVWERQIRSVRKLMCAILHEQHLRTCNTDEQLHTLMCEIEATLNSRPLTKVTDNPNDLDVITPQDLLLLRPRTNMPPGCFDQKDIYSRRRWRQIQYLADLFWRRWLKEYLPELQRRQRWLQPQRNLQVGDVVLIVDETAPRNSWLLGKVLKTRPDKNGQVRQVDVQTKTSILSRPITKLCLLLESEE